MPRRQTGYQILKSSIEHCEFKWLGLLLLYKSLITKSTDKDSAFKGKKKRLLQISSGHRFELPRSKGH